MNQIISKSDITADQQVIDAHQFLVAFLAKFETAKRGGVHDFMEIIIFNMINMAIGNVDAYLHQGHKEVNANEVMAVVAESYQKVLDNIKRNLDGLKEVQMK